MTPSLIEQRFRITWVVLGIDSRCCALMFDVFGVSLSDFVNITLICQLKKGFAAAERGYFLLFSACTKLFCMFPHFPLKCGSSANWLKSTSLFYPSLADGENRALTPRSKAMGIACQNSSATSHAQKKAGEQNLNKTSMCISSCKGSKNCDFFVGSCTGTETCENR